MPALCYFAWYSATSAAGAAVGSTTQGTIEASASDISGNDYTINFETSTVSVELTNNNNGTLERGIWNTAGNGTKIINVDSTSVANCVKAIEITATMASAPAKGTADYSYLIGKTITGAKLDAAGNVFLSTTQAYTSVSESQQASLTVTVSEVNNAIALTVNEIVYVRIQTNNPDGPEFYQAAEKSAGVDLYGQSAASNPDPSGTASYHSADALSVSGTLVVQEE